MDLALITMKQVAVLFILIFSGFLCVKINVLKLEWKQVFSNLLLYLITPCLVINSYITDYDPSILTELIKTFGWSFVFLMIGIVITMLLSFKIKDANKGIIQFACSFSNAAYMGFPLIGALFGNIGLLYASAFFTVFNILLWTFGYTIVSGELGFRQIIKNIFTQPVIIAVAVGLVIYLGRIPIPSVISLSISNIASMNTPISMIITGMIISDTRILSLLKNKKLLFIIVVRMLLIPAACFLVFKVMGINSLYGKIVLLLEACPVAAITSVFAVKFNYDDQLAAGAVVITTFISIITLPLWSLAITMWL